jgi:hypothetical protein
MKLELGKRYRTRDGQETSPLEKSNNLFYPFIAQINAIIHYWTEKGSWSRFESYHLLDLVEEIEETEEKQELKIDYDKLLKEWVNRDDAFTYAWNEKKYTKTEKEDGTIILKPKKRKIWIEVYEFNGEIYIARYRGKDNLDESIKFGQKKGETLLEVIERDYPINNP